jgi:hypothetical protein
MYQPGDYVVGYPDFYESDGKKYLKKSFYASKPGDIICYEDKEELIWGITKYARPSSSEYPRDTSSQFKTKPVCIHYTDFKGMVIQADGLDEARPHWDGIVQVLVDEKLLWVWARNVRLVIFAGTKS